MKYNKLKPVDPKKKATGVEQKVDRSRCIDLNHLIEYSDFKFQVCNSGNFVRKAFELTKTFDWVIGYDNEDQLVLIPLAKVDEKEGNND